MAKVFGQDPPKDEQDANLPPELQGKSKEEMYDTLKAEHTRVVNEIKSDKLDDLLSGAKGGQTATPPAAPARQAPPSTPQNTNQGPPPVSYQQPMEQAADPVMDPGGFMQQQLNARLAPIVQTTVSALRATNREVFKGKKGEEFDKYEEEIEQFVSALSPQLQADPRAYQQGFDYVRSLHLDEIIEEKSAARSAGTLAQTLAAAGVDEAVITQVVQAQGNGGAPAAEAPARSSLFQPQVGVPPRVASAASSPSAGGAQAARTNQKFTAKEKEMMEQFDMTPDEWAAERAENTDTVSSLRGEI